jgi:hypothetical protein
VFVVVVVAVVVVVVIIIVNANKCNRCEKMEQFKKLRKNDEAGAVSSMPPPQSRTSMLYIFIGKSTSNSQ